MNPLTRPFPRQATAMKPATCSRPLRLVAALAWLAAPATGPAQDDLSQAAGNDLARALVTVGTTIEVEGQGAWAYLTWTAGDTRLLVDRAWSVHRREGAADSASPYARVAVLRTQTNEPTVRALLRRGELLGDDLAEVESRVDQLFGSWIPAQGMPLEDKVATVALAATLDASVFADLRLLARVHPAVALALGLAHAERVGPGPTTFEVRACPEGFAPANPECTTVVGRVTVDPTAPVVLPAPGRPVSVPAPNAQGDLNIRLRWSSPDALRRLALLQVGYDLVRMDESFAASGGHLDEPPTPTELAALLESNPAEVRRVNRLPIVAPRELDEAEAASPLDRETYFVIDDNGLADGRPPFVNGQRFAYFAAARDVLGRRGLVSEGVVVTACDKMPPPAPLRTRVTNDERFDPVTLASRQALRVTWTTPPAKEGETITGYHVYRWPDVQTAQRHPDFESALPFLVAGPVAHPGPGVTISLVDDGPGAPTVATDLGMTWWYSVRAVDAGACGGNQSPDSPYAFGVLRDREGPPAPSGSVSVLCGTPSLEFVGVSKAASRDPLDPDCLHLRAEGLGDGVALRSFELWRSRGAGDPPRRVATARFRGPRVLEASLRFDTCDEGPADIEPQSPPGKPTVADAAAISTWYAAVVTASGQRSALVPASFVPTPEATPVVHVLTWAASFQPSYGRPSGPGTPCGLHLTADHLSGGGSPGPGVGGKVNPLKLKLDLTPTTREWRLYRRVDDGEATLLRQGIADHAVTPQVDVDDFDLPQNASRVCYFLQVFDEHGNGSPLARLGDCIETAARTPPAAPLLGAPSPAGDEDAPRMRVRWFSPAHGVDRFEVLVGRPGQGPQPPGEGGGFGGFDLAALPSIHDEDGLVYTPHRTGRVGVNFPAGPAFDIEIPVLPGPQYTVKVVAIAPDGQRSEPSNAATFRFTVPPPVPGPDVPWPARGLPDVHDPFGGRIVARLLDDPAFDGIGILVGGYVDPINPGLADPSDPGAQPSQSYRFRVPASEGSLEDVLFRDDRGLTPLPCVLYRYQVANENFPTVPGDLVQVSPLLASPAQRPAAGGGTEVWDPYLLAVRPDDKIHDPEVFLLDTQPIVAGARYGYLLVRFTARGEIDVVIPVGELDVITAQ